MTRFKTFRKKLTLPLLWDGVMVYLAIINVLLIAFDFTYFRFRPFYVARIPWVPSIYDRVKGVHPHPFTARYLERVDEVERLSTGHGDRALLQPALRDLRDLSVEMLHDDPFEFSRSRLDVERIKLLVAYAIGAPATVAASTVSAEVAFVEFWTDDPELLPQRLEVFQESIRPTMAANYYREFDVRGNSFKDLFWLIDLPFFVLFASEFLVQWRLSVRRRQHLKWYQYPLFHWYDVAGLVPYFRGFRLFRIVSIYIRLYRSDRSKIGDDIVSRAVRYVATAITEEISDMVTLRILDQTQVKVREGVYIHAIRDQLTERREAIRDGVVDALEQVFARDELRNDAREFVRSNLDQSVDSAAALRGLPVPDALLRPLVRAIGLAVFDALAETVPATLAHEEGRLEFERVVEGVLDALVRGTGTEQLEGLIQDVTLEMLERTKGTVAVQGVGR